MLFMMLLISSPIVEASTEDGREVASARSHDYTSKKMMVSLSAYLLILILLVGGYLGSQLGLLGSLFVYVVSFFLEYAKQNFRDPLISFFKNIGIQDTSYLNFSAAILLIAVFLALFMAINKIVNLVLSITLLKSFNQWLGAVLGVLQAIMMVSVLFGSLAEELPFINDISPVLNQWFPSFGASLKNFVR